MADFNDVYKSHFRDVYHSGFVNKDREKSKGNTAQKKVPDTGKCDIINLWINR